MKSHVGQRVVIFRTFTGDYSNCADPSIILSITACLLYICMYKIAFSSSTLLWLEFIEVHREEIQEVC